jgi:Sulfotransferase domain
MPRRRNGPLSNGSSLNGDDNSSSSSDHESFLDSLMTGRTRRLVILISLMACAFYYLNAKERQALDEAHYQDARKAYFKNVDNHHARYTTTYHYSRPKGPTGQFVLQPINEFTPAIAWLMSFPNSGTSFTMTMVTRASNKSLASNYGDEVTAPDQPDSLSIYPRRPEGPFWPGMSGKIASPRELPDKYVITKTHCGSRCVECGPDEYIETPTEFLRRCALGHAWLTPAKERRKYDVEYPPERVARAIHLYRHPLHNIIARYHLEHRHKGYGNKTSWLETHSNDAAGLHVWCDDLRKTYAKEDKAYFKENVPSAPCHGEFYKWTQWHNLVHESLDLIPHKMPILTVYYEDYSANFNETTLAILDFLELKQVMPLREFSARSDYDGYFTPEEKESIKSLIQEVASAQTWGEIKHYFEEGVY